MTTTLDVFIFLAQIECLEKKGHKQQLEAIKQLDILNTAQNTWKKTLTVAKSNKTATKFDFYYS